MNIFCSIFVETNQGREHPIKPQNFQQRTFQGQNDKIMGKTWMTNI